MNQTTLRRSISLRVGLCFLLISIATWAVSCWGTSVPSASQETGLNAPSIGWTILTGLVAACGIASLHSVAGLAAIERQLHHAATSPPLRSDALNQDGSIGAMRPIISRAPAVRGYNRLLQAAIEAERPAPERTRSKLDESAITHARAMRVIDTAWVITDEDCMIRYISPKAKGLLQCDLHADDLESVSIFECLQLEDPGEIKRFTNRVRSVRSTLRIENSGEEAHLDVTRSRLSGRDGDCEGMVWLIEDRTSQTIALRSRDDFLMTATHELRTPLTNLRAYGEALASEDQADIEQQKEFCNIIVSESIRMGRMIDHLLSMGQIEAGTLLIENREVDLHAVFGDVEDQVRGQIEEKQQTFVLDVADKLPTVRGDSDKLRSALINLVGNAVKYTPDQGTITVRCFTEEDGGLSQVDVPNTGPNICIEVIDDGTGIEEADQPRVFEKFFRCAASQSVQQGNGLGLAFAREVAKLHQGSLTLESQLGQGSNFTMRLPAFGQARSGVSH